MSAWGPFLLVGLIVVGVVGSCVGAGGTFGQRCGMLYQGAALERCVMRLGQGGPLYEENIGYRP